MGHTNRKTMIITHNINANPNSKHIFNSFPVHRNAYTRKYRDIDEKNKTAPLLDVFIGSKKKTKIAALADTGCAPFLMISKSFIEDSGLELKRMGDDDDYIRISVADGHSVNGYPYKGFCQVGGKEVEVEVCAVDTSHFFDDEKPDFPALIGREFLDKYDVLFKGKDKKIVICHPE